MVEELLQADIARRVRYLKLIPMTAEKHAALGAEQWQARISELVGPRHADEPTLRLKDAVLAFVSALAHLAVADGREWS